MDPITAIVAGLSLVIVAVVSVVLYINNRDVQSQLDSKMKNVVGQLNSSQYTAYQFDQKQQGNMQKMEKSLVALNDKIDATNQQLEGNKEAIDKDINKIQGDYLSKDALPIGVPYIKTGRLQIGAHNIIGPSNIPGDSNTSMLAIYDREGSNVDGHLLLKDISVMRNAALSNVATNNTSVFNELNIRTTGDLPFTTFRAGSSNNIYGNTNLNGNLDVEGTLSATNGLNAKGRLQFFDEKQQISDTYYLEKVRDNVNTALRMTLNNQPTNSFEIRAGAANAHVFTADGKATHTNSLSAKSVSAGSYAVTGNVASLTGTGTGHVNAAFGIGMAPTEKTAQKLTVTGGTPKEFSTIIDHTGTTISMAKDTGEGIIIRTPKVDNSTSAIAVYSAAGELLNVKNDGAISMGMAARDTILLGDLKVAKTLDAFNDGTGAKPLGIGATSSKVVIGNNASAGIGGYANTKTPKADSVVVTNPLYVQNTLKVDRTETDTLPSGWLGGIHASQIHASGTIGTGINGINQAYMTSQGDIYSRGNQVSSDIRLKDNITPITANDTSKLASLNPVSYTMKSDPKERKRFGFISQEVEKVYPNLVYESMNGTQALDYTGIIPLVVDRVQDINKVVKPDNKQICLGDTCLTEEDLKALKKRI